MPGTKLYNVKFYDGPRLNEDCATLQVVSHPKFALKGRRNNRQFHQTNNSNTISIKLSSFNTKSKDSIEESQMGRFERLPSNASCGCCGIFKGSLNGFHTFEFADGSTYEGEWVSGHPNGVGKYVWASGTLYSGQFSKGVPSGQGQLLLADGTVYLGAFSGGQIGGGSGEVRFTPGTVGAEAAAFQANGHCNTNAPCWFGTEEAVWGCQGEFLSSNTAEGHGVFQFPNKTRVESDWKEGSNVESAERDRERQERERERATKAAKGRRDPPARRSSQHSRDKGMNGVSADSFKINPGQVLIDSSQGSIRLRRKAKLEAEGSERCLELVAAP